MCHLDQIVFILSDSNQFDDCVFIHTLKYSAVLGWRGGTFDLLSGEQIWFESSSKSDGTSLMC